MRRTVGRVGLLTLLLTGLTLGCHKPMVQHKAPPDPLLISKKPIEGKPELAEPVQAVRIEPLPPALPPPLAPDLMGPGRQRTVNYTTDKNSE
jgi:hypothetical protein